MRIVAVIVTFNRYNLLIKLLEELQRQTRQPDRVFIINNASTDTAYIDVGELQRLPDYFTVITLDQNTGGAGGFNIGIQLAHEQGFDAAWLMDDDGMPAHDQLEKLERSFEIADLDMAAPLVLAEDDRSVLAFGLIDERRIKGPVPSIWTASEAGSKAEGGLLPYMANPFNGVLIRCKVLSSTANVRAEMFIWGDEVDFMRRVIAGGGKIATVVDAEHYHPKPKGSFVDTAFGALRLVPPERQVFLYRNQSYNLLRHKGLLVNGKRYLRLLLQLLSKARLKEALVMTAYWLDGMADNYALAPSRKKVLSSYQQQLQNARRQANMNSV